MARAIRLSKRGFPAPNPHVGCVIAQGDRIVGEGHHEFAGGPHAEAVALAKAGSLARGATAYVTLEPCAHVGRTTPCADALIAAGVARVVVALEDPTERAGGGLRRLAAAGIATECGLMAEAAHAENGMWLTAASRRRPFVVAKAAITLDGMISTPSGESRWITGELARKAGHRLRAECGAVLVGSGTAISDDPHLTVRALRVRNQPLRIVLDPERVVPSDARVFDRAAPSVRVVASNAQENELAAPLSVIGFDLERLLDLLYARGVTALLVEGGAKTIGAFLRERLIDRLELFVAGKVLGAGRSWAEIPFQGVLADAPRFSLQALRRVGEDIRLTYGPLAGTGETGGP